MMGVFFRSGGISGGVGGVGIRGDPMKLETSERRRPVLYLFPQYLRGSTDKEEITVRDKEECKGGVKDPGQSVTRNEWDLR